MPSNKTKYLFNEGPIFLLLVVGSRKLVPTFGQTADKTGLERRGCKENILVQTHKCSLLIMGLHIFEVELCQLNSSVGAAWSEI